MSKNGQTVMFERHPCPHCRKEILILDAEDFPELTPEETNIQKALSVLGIKTGDTISCPHCHKQIIVQ